MLGLVLSCNLQAKPDTMQLRAPSFTPSDPKFSQNRSCFQRPKFHPPLLGPRASSDWTEEFQGPRMRHSLAERLCGGIYNTSGFKPLDSSITCYTVERMTGRSASTRFETCRRSTSLIATPRNEHRRLS